MISEIELDNYESRGTKNAKVLNMLRNREYVTNIEIIEKLNVTCPHGYIRNLRKHFGADFVLDETVNKKTKEMYNGKMHTVTTNYKKYFLNKMGA